MLRHKLPGFLIILFSLKAFNSFAQVGIGTNNPHPSAALDINFTSRGLLLPRVALTGVTDNVTIPQPAVSLLVYNTNNAIAGGNGAGIYYNAGSQASPQWTRLQTAGGLGQAWTLTGNSGTNPANNFVGTTNASALVFRTNNIPSGRIDPTLRSYFFGENAGISNTGSGNVGIGHSALRNNTIRGGLVAIGDSALYANGTGVTNSTQANFNTAVGSRSQRNNTTGYGNTAIGTRSLLFNTTGFLNTALGWDALQTNSTGDSNTAVGARALYVNTTGRTNTAVGAGALVANTTASQNTAVGVSALSTNVTGSGNTAVGYTSMQTSTGSFNTAVGVRTLNRNFSGERNTAIGFEALEGAAISVPASSDNVAVGYRALRQKGGGSSNTAVGSMALQNTTGDGNTAVGTTAGSTLTTGSNNTFIGAGITLGSTTLTNATAIGYGAIISSSNSVRIGNNQVTSIGGQVAFTATSDMRVKTHVRQDVPGLDFILRLRPVSYFMHSDALQARQSAPLAWHAAQQQALGKQRHIGLLAQEVEAAAKEIGFEFDGVEVPKEPNETYSLRYSVLTVPLIKAVQEQQEQIEELLKRANELRSRLESKLNLLQGTTTIHQSQK